MTYRLVFKADAKKEWDKLDSTIREQFKNKLAERIAAPRVESSRLSGMKDCYKIQIAQCRLSVGVPGAGL